MLYTDGQNNILIFNETWRKFHIHILSMNLMTFLWLVFLKSKHILNNL